MDLLTKTVFEGLEARLSGPGKGRFILQPLMSTALGVRDGIRDAKEGKPPYLIRVLSSNEPAFDVVKIGLKSITIPLSLGVILDLILQKIIFNAMYLLPALFAGTVLVAFPYSVARALSNRVARRWLVRSPSSSTQQQWER
jgi:hypothetical protein